MWAIRILSGPQAGQIFPLKTGKNTIGRAPSCEIKVASNSVSKEHAAILMTDDKLILTDLNSRNGTFVNGVRIQNQRVSLGDKLSLHDVVIDIVDVPANATFGPAAMRPSASAPPPPAWAGNAALRVHDYGQPSAAPGEASVIHAQIHAQMHAQMHGQMNPHMHADAQSHLHMAPPPAAPAPQARMSSGSLSDVFYNFKIYIDNVAMPGVYAVVQGMPYRYALAALVALYVMIVTSLSTIPTVSLTKRAIQQESVRRAKTIARNLAAWNRQAIIEHNDIAMTTRAAELEEGVTAALIISAKDGTIMAPANKRGEFSNKPFVNQARREERETDAFIDDSNLGVAVPISQYNADTGSQSIVAYSIVLYDMGALAMNTSQTLSLFIQTLAISLIMGGLLYFFLIKIVEHPIDVLNGGVDDALREGRDDLTTDYQFPALERLVSNINSALTRIGRGGGNEMGAEVVVNRDVEAANIVRMLPIAAVTVNAIDDRVISTNRQFDQLVGGGVNLVGRPVTDIPDPALKANLADLLPRMRVSVGEIALSEIPFSGEKYEICGQAVMGGSDPAYFLITLHPMEIG